jgi:hypothetical protein
VCARRELAAWRAALKEKRRIREKAILHKEVTSINGTLCNIKWARKDTRDCSLDMTVLMTVYVPTTGGSWVFTISEKEIKDFAEKDKLNNPGNVSFGETMAVPNLLRLKSRLKCRMVKNKSAKLDK